MFQSNPPDGFGWRSRHYLQHFDNGYCPQFLTARLFDSMPQEVPARWEEDLNSGNITDADLRRRVEYYLDNGYGSCLLRNADVAQMVCETLHRGNRVDYDLHSYVVMPNHLHLLLTQIDFVKFEKIAQQLKSITAHRANKILGRSGRFWFPEPFDRFIRSPEHFDNVVRYIENNPVKARLCKDPADWPFSSATRRR